MKRLDPRLLLRPRRTHQLPAVDALPSAPGDRDAHLTLQWEPSLCAHSSRGITGCTRCLEVCPVNAIRSEAGEICVNSDRCQGCANCSLACPTGALSYRSADRAGLVAQMQRLLGDAGSTAALIVHEDTWDEARCLLAGTLGAAHLQVTAVPAFGDELWLHALALGAQVLVLLLPEGTPIKTLQLMRQQVAQSKLVLQAMGHEANRLVCIDADGLLDWMKQNQAHQARATPAKSRVPTLPSWVKFKRLAWIDGIRQLGVLPTAHPTSLPQGSSMGKLQANTARCSLCFACTHVCPTRALAAVNEVTQKLVFQESACVQCGLCVKACPEDALHLLPRMAAAHFSQMMSVVLHQEVQVKCTGCGTPFIGRRQLASSLERLKDHAIMRHGAREALLICPSCRQQEMLVT